jgi:hypothetical protein
MKQRMKVTLWRVAVWVPTVLLVLLFAKQGWAKFSDTSGWAVAFRHWGYPDWFRVTIGVVELTAAACLLWVRTAAVGVALITCVMLGGMATHIIHDGGRHMTSEVGPLLFAAIVFLARRRERSALATSATPSAGFPA